MRIIQKTFQKYGEFTAYLHEPNPDFSNIRKYPAILILPGSGFVKCCSREGEPVAMAFYAEGYQAFVLDYTTKCKDGAAEIDVPMEDVRQAIAYIRGNADEFMLDPEKLALLGFSAGAHLSAAVATHGPLRPNAVLLGYPAIPSEGAGAMGCPDILERVDENTPPFFIFCTRDDYITPPANAIMMADALDKQGIDFEVHIFKHGPHGMSLGIPLTSDGKEEFVNPDFAQWLPLSLSWLKQLFGDFPVDYTYVRMKSEFSADTPLCKLSANEEAKKILFENFPMMDELIQDHRARNVPFRIIAENIPMPEYGKEKVRAADALLRQIGNKREKEGEK